MHTDSDMDALPPYDFQSKTFCDFFMHTLESEINVYIMLSTGQALLFFKYYDPNTTMVSCVAHSVESIEKRFCKSALTNTSSEL